MGKETEDGDGMHFDPDLVSTEFDQLMKFYDVTNNCDLIRIQAKHIERLQAKLPKTPDQFPRTPRDG